MPQVRLELCYRQVEIDARLVARDWRDLPQPAAAQIVDREGRTWPGVRRDAMRQPLRATFCETDRIALCLKGSTDAFRGNKR
jgi:hypothetical protein